MYLRYRVCITNSSLSLSVPSLGQLMDLRATPDLSVKTPTHTKESQGLEWGEEAREGGEDDSQPPT